MANSQGLYTQPQWCGWFLKLFVRAVEIRFNQLTNQPIEDSSLIMPGGRGLDFAALALYIDIIINVEFVDHVGSTKITDCTLSTIKEQLFLTSRRRSVMIIATLSKGGQ